MNNLYEIPKSWKWTTLDDVFLIERGGSPRPIKSFITESNDGINWIKIGDTKVGQKYIETTKEMIIPEGLKKSRLVVEGDFILSNSMSFGRPYIMKTKGAIHDGWLVFRDATKELNKDFFYHLLSSSYIYQQFSHNASGSTVKNLNIEIVKQTNISLPPLNEQKRIVEKTENLFLNLDNSDKHLKHLERQLKRYRQSVLKSAFDGKLTREWRIKNQVNQQWKTHLLDDITEKITDGEHFKPKTSENGIYFLSAKDVQHNGIDFSNPLYISEDTAKKALMRCNPEFNDILIVSRGASVGRMCIVETHNTFCLLGSVILIKPSISVHSRFLTYLLKSPDINKILITASGSTAQQAIYLRDIRKIKLDLPLFIEQEEIVLQIDKHMSIIDKLESVVQKSIKESKRLRQSILKQAFEGKLVEQDLNDESAEILLEKIAKAKEEYKKALKRKKK